jgi:photosystem II stability/assembly factor-like uncharacterized protein
MRVTVLVILALSLGSVCGGTALAQDGWYVVSHSLTNHVLRDVRFADANTGMAVGEAGTILRTTDGGVTWEVSRLPIATTGVLNGVFFNDANTGTVVGQDTPGRWYESIIFRTTDGGVTWGQQMSGPDVEIFDVSFADINTGIVVGWGGTIFRTTDGGVAWHDTTVDGGWNGVFLIDASTGIVVGFDGKIIRTTDGGVTWEHQVSGEPVN